MGKTSQLKNVECSHSTLLLQSNLQIFSNLKFLWKLYNKVKFMDFFSLLRHGVEIIPSFGNILHG